MKPGYLHESFYYRNELWTAVAEAKVLVASGWFFEGDEDTLEHSHHNPEWREFWEVETEQLADHNHTIRWTPRSEDSDH